MPSVSKALLAVTALCSISAASKTVQSTVLLITPGQAEVDSTKPVLNGYGIPFDSVIIPKEGKELPKLNSTANDGAYSSIVIVGPTSGLKPEQWKTLYDYQTAFKVRMVRLNESPNADSGTKAVAPCCDGNIGARISLPADSVNAIPGAGLKAASVDLQNIYHYPGVITDTKTTTTFATFDANKANANVTVAAVINNFNGREQMVWFMPFNSEWSAVTAYLQHSYFHWMTRSLYAGKRKIHYNIQVDDMQISTELYYPKGKEFKIAISDLDGHITWQKSINSRMSKGSDIWLEIGHNGNGNLEASTNMKQADGVCVPIDAVEYGDQAVTPTEFKKPPGTGTDIWPPQFKNYTWSDACSKLDNFTNWFRKPENLNAYGHVSHTFTHESLNNATYLDAVREIQFNQAWMKQVGIDKATRFSGKGLIPPAITGLHNADALQAWYENGLRFAVGDNTRPVLRNTKNAYWPLATNVEDNGREGIWIIPRWATVIDYNCHTVDCARRQWKATSGKAATMNEILAVGRDQTMNQLMNLQSDPYMFHQANMHQNPAGDIVVGDQKGKLSLIMGLIEISVQEITRLTTWPVTSLKHDDFAQYFIDRMTHDNCKPHSQFIYSDDGASITSIVVTANGNTCSTPIPVTIPTGTAAGGAGDVTNVDQVVSEPPIVWVTLTGKPVTLKLSTPVKL